MRNGESLAHLAGARWAHHQDPKFAHDGNVSCVAKLLFYIGDIGRHRGFVLKWTILGYSR